MILDAPLLSITILCFSASLSRTTTSNLDVTLVTTSIRKPDTSFALIGFVVRSARRYRHDHRFSLVYNASGTIRYSAATLKYISNDIGDGEVAAALDCWNGTDLLRTSAQDIDDSRSQRY
jgi:hypothetical protein